MRWRIAITTAGLTLAILVLFALVLGKMVGDRVRADFEDELRNAAGALATETRVGVEPINGEPVIYSPKLDDFAMADDAVISVVDGNGNAMASTKPAVPIGAAATDVTHRGDLSVASRGHPRRRLPFSSNTPGPTRTSRPRFPASTCSSWPAWREEPCSHSSRASPWPTTR